MMASANIPTDRPPSAAALSAFKAAITTDNFKAIAAAAQERNAIAAAAQRAKPVPDGDDDAELARVWRPERPIAVYVGGPHVASKAERETIMAELRRQVEEDKARRDA